jgi:hypothetical protein
MKLMKAAVTLDATVIMNTTLSVRRGREMRRYSVDTSSAWFRYLVSPSALTIWTLIAQLCSEAASGACRGQEGIRRVGVTKRDEHAVR